MKSQSDRDIEMCGRELTVYGCDKAIELNHGTLKDNHYNYCPCCGGEIIYKPEEAANDKLTGSRP